MILDRIGDRAHVYHMPATQTWRILQGVLVLLLVVYNAVL